MSFKINNLFVFILIVSSTYGYTLDIDTPVRPKNNTLPLGGINPDDPTHQLWNVQPNEDESIILHDRIPPRPDQLIAIQKPDEVPDQTGEPTIIIPSNIVKQNKKTNTVITKRIYKCRDKKSYVFVDEDLRKRFNQCELFSVEEHPVLTEEDLEENNFNLENNDSCIGTIVYKGNTYILSNKEPCPIPNTIFQSMKSLQSNPDYYLD